MTCVAQNRKARSPLEKSTAANIRAKNMPWRMPKRSYTKAQGLHFSLLREVYAEGQPYNVETRY
jgi:hypothetical protein